MNRRIVLTSYILTLATGAIFAQEMETPPGNAPIEKSARNRWHFELQAGAGGARIRSAGEGPEDSSPASLTDQFQSAGIVIDSRSEEPEDSSPDSGVRALFRLRAGLQLSLGEHRYARRSSTDGRREDEAVQSFAVLPGNDLYAGVSFCSAPENAAPLESTENTLTDNLECAFLLGRAGGDPLFHRLSGSHGSLTGVHLTFALPLTGRLVISPLHRPELAGTYLEARDDPRADAYAGRTAIPGMYYGANRRDADFFTVARSAEAYGSRAAFTAGHSIFRIGFSYDHQLRRDSAPREIPDEQRRLDHIEYTGFGLGLSNDHLASTKDTLVYHAFVHLERSAGSYRTLLADENAERSTRIEGHALSTGAGLSYGRLAFGLAFFLPEPGRTTEGSNPVSVEESGYVGFGDSLIHAPILSDTLNARAFPSACPYAAACHGLLTETNADGEGFRNHAAMFSAHVTYRGERVFVRPSVTVFSMLAKRPATGGGTTPFAKLKKDPHGFEFREYDLRLGYAIPDGALELLYARLYRRGGSGTGGVDRRERLKGEALFLRFRYYL